MSQKTFYLDIIATGEIRQSLDELAQLRIKVFAQYPYLYAGTQAYEKDYLQALAGAKDAIVVVVKNNKGEVVGCSTGSALTSQHDSFSRPLLEQKLDIDKIFYFGESVLEDDWRGLGLGHEFFDHREAHAQSLGYTHTCFCAVERPEDDPRKPDDYHPLDSFWQGRGYSQMANVRAYFNWPEEPGGDNLEHPMVYWIKAL